MVVVMSALVTDRISKAVELRHAHTSDIVKGRGADIFLWSKINGGLNDEGGLKYQLVASFNSKTVGPVTASNLLRWQNLLFRIVDEEHVDSDLMIRPVSLTRMKPFLYRPDPVDEMVPLSKILSPGDYGYFYRDENESFYEEYPFTTMYPLRIASKYREKMLSENQEDKEALIDCLSSGIFAHLSHVCVLSGVGSDHRDVEANWILPPSKADWAPTHGPATGMDPECVENMLTMRSDLYKLWLSYSLAVDVDDDLRIRTFTKEASNLRDLRQQLLWHSPALTERSRIFFREHLKLALSLHLAGGDNRKGRDASTPGQQDFMHILGVSEDSPPNEANFIQNKNEWQKPMGIEILSTMWPLSELPSIAREVVRGASLEDAMTGLALK